MNPQGQQPQHFDEYADNYDQALSQALSATGESKDYFARGRIRFLRDLLPSAVLPVRRIVDFGCGTGSATPHLRDAFSPELIYGVDVSSRSIEVAQREHADESTCFEILGPVKRAGEFDLAFVNGVFHHIPPAERDDAAKWVFETLKPGGIFAFWENNPWNPGTRYAMYRCAFDDDAITLSVLEARRLLRRAGFEILRCDFLFIFPRILRMMRWMERPLSRLPLGGQYQVLCRKPL